MINEKGPDIFESGEQTLEQGALRGQQSLVNEKVTKQLTTPAIVDGVGEVDELEKAKPLEEDLDYSRKIVIIKPIAKGKFKLGLELTQEKYLSFPGTVYRWSPKKVGNSYRTGLHRDEMGHSRDERQRRLVQLERDLGRRLDADYYEQMSVKLDTNKGIGERFVLAKATDFVIWLAMLESDIVANGLHEYESGAKPYAEWYIENKELEAEKKATARSIYLEANKVFGGLSNTKKMQLAIMAGCNVYGLSPLAVENELWGWMDDNPKTKEMNTKLFLAWIKEGDTFLSVSALVKNAIAFSVISKRPSGDYYYDDALLGTTEAEVIGKLSKPQGGDLRIGITHKVDLKL